MLGPIASASLDLETVRIRGSLRADKLVIMDEHLVADLWIPINTSLRTSTTCTKIFQCNGAVSFAWRKITLC